MENRMCSSARLIYTSVPTFIPVYLTMKSAAFMFRGKLVLNVQECFTRSLFCRVSLAFLFFFNNIFQFLTTHVSCSTKYIMKKHWFMNILGCIFLTKLLPIISNERIILLFLWIVFLLMIFLLTPDFFVNFFRNLSLIKTFRLDLHWLDLHWLDFQTDIFPT